jgi:enoyl-CoA hydratase/carnithine racemase
MSAGKSEAHASTATDLPVLETLVVRREGAVLFADIAAPPMNLLGPELVRGLVALIKAAEADEAFQVLVFRSKDPDYFIPHVDVTKIKEYRAEAAKLSGEPSIALLFRHLSASRLVSIAQIEGRVRAAGSEFVLACDMRFAARETAVFAQFEPAFGQLPGGGAAQHLTRLMGRSRALEVMLSAEDFDAELAERYGWINRCLPASELSGFRLPSRPPNRGVSRRRACRRQGARQRDRARTRRGLSPLLRTLRRACGRFRRPEPDPGRDQTRPPDAGGRADNGRGLGRPAVGQRGPQPRQKRCGISQKPQWGASRARTRGDLLLAKRFARAAERWARQPTPASAVGGMPSCRGTESDDSALPGWNESSRGLSAWPCDLFAPLTAATAH